MSTPADATTTQPHRRLSSKTIWILGSSLVAGRDLHRHLGGGWDLSNSRAEVGSEEILAALESGRYELSIRRLVSVHGIERKVRA